MPLGTVLVVEDDYDVRDAIGSFLEASGYNVQCAANGEEGLRLLQDAPMPVVVLLDMVMPGMDGLSFLRWQRAHAALRDIPVILLSGVVRSEVALADLQPTACLTKPVDGDELIAAVGQAMRRSRQ